MSVSDEYLAAQEPLLETGGQQHDDHVYIIHADDPQAHENQHAKNSIADTVFLFIGIYVGLGLLSQHYAIKEGGWLSLILLPVCCTLFSISALLVHASLDKLPEDVRKNFTDLGETALGSKSIVGALAVLELFGGSTVTLLIIWEQLELLLPSNGILGEVSATASAIVLSIVFLIPLVALPDLSKISRLSILGNISSVMVITAVMALIVIDPHREHQSGQPAAGHDLFMFPFGALKAIGLFAVSMSGHSAVPSIRSAMKAPKDFPRAVVLSYSIMGILYGSLAACGYWYFGSASSPVITTDLANNSPYSHSSGILPSFMKIDAILALLVMMNCTTKLPALMMVLQQIVVGVVWEQRGPSPRQRTLFGIRLALSMFAGAVALTARNYLGNVISLIGGICGMSTSLLLPVLFYISMCWQDISRTRKVGLVLMGGVGFVLLVFITLLNIRQILGHRNDAFMDL